MGVQRRKRIKQKSEIIRIVISELTTFEGIKIMKYVRKGVEIQRFY